MVGVPVRRMSKRVALVYGGVSLAILLAVAMVALVVSPPSPPAIAEFAPKDAERIDDALKSQASQFGEGEGGDCAEGQECAFGEGSGGAGADGGSTTTSRAVVDQNRVRRCVGNPPRQTEDPQSPPCINYWEGDNGGATTPGVTRDEIRIAAPQSWSGDNYFEKVVRHFNKRYELYGRQIRLVEVPPSYSDPDALVAAAKEQKAFALLSEYGGSNFEMSHLQEQAAREGIITVLDWTTYAPAADYRKWAPYAWNYAPTADEAQQGTADLVCSSLAGRTARYAGPSQRLTERKFAVLTSGSEGRPLDVSLLKRRAADCGVTDIPTYEIKRGESRDAKAALWLDLQSRDVTTVLLFVHADLYTQWSTIPASGDYQPELVTTGIGVHENEAQWMVGGRASDRAHLFGAWGANKLNPGSDSPSFWAAAESGDQPDPAMVYHYDRAYHQLLFVASGIQMAGPRLTPETFAAGLQKAKFPNPGAGTAPYYQARVGFGPGDYAMTEGFTAAWFSDSAPSYGGFGASRQGGWCYVRRGQRFDTGAWPDLSNDFHNPDPTNCR